MKTRSYRRKCINTQSDMNDTTFKKLKSVDIQPDVISNLPSNVLYKIVECLPLRDAARTSVLSHKWYQIWISIPSLVFDEQSFRSLLKEKPIKIHVFCGIITRVLLQHENPILKFSLFVPLLEFNPFYERHYRLDVTQWLSYLSRTGISDFSLFNMHCRSIEISSLLYSCGGLEKLKLQGCSFSHLSNFRGLPKLTSLELENVKIKYSILNTLIGSCPALEKLSLQNCVFSECKDLVIDAPTNLDSNVLLDLSPNWTLNHLSCATIVIMRVSSIELKVIECLLGCSPVLQKLSVSLNQPVKLGNYMRMLTLVNQFCRASPEVKVMCESVAYENSSPSSDSLSVDHYTSDSS